MIVQNVKSEFYFFLFIAITLSFVAGYLISQFGTLAIVSIITIPLIIYIIFFALKNPKLGLFFYLQIAFIIPLISHFVPINAPIGTCTEALLILTMIGLFLNAKQMDWYRLHNIAFYFLLIWVAYTCFEFFNPEAPNRLAGWIYHFRVFSFQWLCAAIIVSVIPITRRDVKILLISWLTWSFLAALWAFKQQYIGLTSSEAAWLYSVGAKTHLLFGHLRSFSFYTDAAQLGAEMAGATLACILLVFETKRVWMRIFFFCLSIFFFWAYAVTGTRSALFVIIAGFPFYLIIKRDIVKLVYGGIITTILIFTLMFTSIGNGNYQIYRIRTALQPNEDPSFNLRKANQQKLAAHLTSLPFGAGLGTCMSPGDVLSPNHWASQIPPDTWYVVIWIETGIFGLTLYVVMLLTFVAVGSYKVFNLKVDWLQTIIIILLAEFVGLITMAYGNTIMGQLPTSTLLFISSFVFTTCDRWKEKI